MQESEVRSYSRLWPTTFTHARGSTMRDQEGREYLDFFAGAGSLNYGHNPPEINEALIDYLQRGGPVSSLDMWTEARSQFVEALADLILKSRSLDRHRIQFTSPSGASAIEAALRLARKATGRQRVVTLTGSFHGVTLDAAAASDDARRAGRPTMDPNQFTKAALVPGDPTLSIAELRAAIAQDDRPAAILFEMLQGEGGIRTVDASVARAAAAMAAEVGAALIVDDVQAGCGRTGSFFSFEAAGFTPDIVCLSKSIGGGLPLAVVLIRSDLDVWSPGEHSGTFRGANLSFVAGAAALRSWWSDDTFAAEVVRKGALLRQLLDDSDVARQCVGPVRGRGLMLGLPCRDAVCARAAAVAAFQRGLLVETCGGEGDVVKLLPPLTVLDSELGAAVDILSEALAEATRLDRRSAE